MARTKASLNDVGSTKRLTTGLLESVDSLWTACAKRVSRVSKGLARSRLARPKQLLSNISNKAIHFRRKKKKLDEDFNGDGGVWQRTILMGEKCQPLDFSGVIYYDSNGKRLAELPMRSPRASPMVS